MPDKRTDAKPPTPEQLAATLSRAHNAFVTLTERGRDVTREWRRYKVDTPWVLKVSEGKRTLFYATPKRGAFEAVVLLGPKATEAALAGRVTKKLHAAIREAPAYAEGRPVRVVVKRAADLVGVEQLLAVKLDPAGVPPPRSAKKRLTHKSPHQSQEA